MKPFPRFLLALILSLPGLGQAASRICTDHDTFVFGDRPIGSVSTAMAIVSSCGNQPFVFTEVIPHSATGPGFRIDSTCTTGATMMPGATCTVAVRFAPTTAGQQSGALWLRNDTSTPTQLITFYGRGTGAAAGTSTLAFSPSPLYVGTSEVGIAAPAVRVALRNVGTAPIVPSALVINGPAAYDFLPAGDCGVGRTIPAGGTCHLDFTFTPAAAGTRLANLVVDAPQLSTLAILLIAGTGVLPPTLPSPIDLVEFHHAARDGYFLTAEEAEIAFLDGGGLGPDWQRTGRVLKGYRVGTEVPNEADVCRFFGTPDLGPDSHFYTVDAAECTAVRANPFWQYEGTAFRAMPLLDGACPAGMQVVTRFFKQAPTVTGIRHRYVTRDEDLAAMRAAGWILEGPVFCSPS